MRADGRAYVLLDGASGVLVLPVAAELPLALLVGRRVVVAGDDAATWLVVGLTGATVLNVANGLAQLDGSGKITTSLLNVNVANGVLQLDSSAKVPTARLYTNTVNGVLQLDAGGKVADGLLSSNVGLLNASQTWTSDNTFMGNVGIGLAGTTTIGLRIVQTFTDPTGTVSANNLNIMANLTANNAENVLGASSMASGNSTSGNFITIDPNVIGMQSHARNTGSGTMVGAAAYYARVSATVSGGTITRAYGFLAETPSTPGSFTTAYGLYVRRQKNGSLIGTGYGVYVAHNADSNYFAGNVGVGTDSQWGGGVGVVAMANAATVPATNPTGGGVLYVQGGALRYRGSSGTVTTIAPA